MISMIKASIIEPDYELKTYLDGKVSSDKSAVTVYRDGERPTNGAPDDFIEVAMNGGSDMLGPRIDYAEGYIMLILYTRLNDDGSIKHNRIKKLMAQFDELVEMKSTENYFFWFDTNRFITPPTQDLQSGYSITTLNLRWHTTNNFNKTV